jgi:type I restriction enzyme S subunit
MIGEGRTRGQVAILDVAACNNQNSAAIRVSAARLPAEYTYYFLMSQYEQNRKLGSGNNQPALNKVRVRNIPFPLPPLAEQQRIVAEVERRLSVVEELEAVVNANLQRAIRLRQSILQRAFEGTLLRTEKEEPSVNDESLPLAAEPPGHYEQHR